jgi:hypothetical protein
VVLCTQGGVAKRSNATGCKPVLSEFPGSNPGPATGSGLNPGSLLGMRGNEGRGSVRDVARSAGQAERSNWNPPHVWRDCQVARPHERFLIQCIAKHLDSEEYGVYPRQGYSLTSANGLT